MKKISLFLFISLAILACKNTVEDMNDEFKPLTVVSCDAEYCLNDSSKFLSPGRLQSTTFLCLKSQSSEKAHTGKYSIKLNKKKAFGFTYIIENVQASDSFKISVWRNCIEQKSNIVASTDDSKLFYVSQNVGTEKDNNGWELLTLNAVIPEKAANKTLKIYCWNPDTANVAYFDDLKIQYLNKPKAEVK